MQSLFDTCFTKSGNPDKFASCIYDATEKFKKEQGLLEHKIGFISLSLNKCLETKDTETCKAEAIKNGNQVVSDFNKFVEKM
jgi:hypothetical protein